MMCLRLIVHSMAHLTQPHYHSSTFATPPTACRRFTPLLQAFYKNLMTQRSDTELVFCSLDHSQAEYDEYTADMPWKCLPYSDASSRQQLAMQYGAQGIPHLVVVNRNDGSVITEDGTESLQTNPTGFPWKPPTFAELWPTQYLAADGTTLVDSATLASKHLMLYFSAHWYVCNQCEYVERLMNGSVCHARVGHTTTHLPCFDAPQVSSLQGIHPRLVHSLY